MTPEAHGVRATLTNVLCLTVLASTMNFAQTTPTIASAAPIATLVPRIDAIVQRYMQDAHVPGLVYGIVRHGRGGAATSHGGHTIPHRVDVKGVHGARDSHAAR